MPIPDGDTEAATSQGLAGSGSRSLRGAVRYRFPSTAAGALPAPFGLLFCCSSLNPAGETESPARSSPGPLAFLLQARN